MGNPLQALLELPEYEKSARGLQYTPREIYQQPETWKTTYQRCFDLAPELKQVLRRAGIGSDHPPIVYLLGAGTSDYIGRALAGLLRRRWKTDVWAIASTTMLTEQESVHDPAKNYLWISFSRSGDSPEGVALLQRTLQHHPNVQHLIVSCNRDGKMAELCRRNPDRSYAIVLEEATNDRGLAMTSSFTNMLVAGHCLAHLSGLSEYGDILDQMIDVGTRFLPLASEAAASIADQECARGCFVGTGPLRAAAEECALKLVELTAGNVVTVSESALGLRHGPMSVIDSASLFVALLSSDARRRAYELDLLEEISRKDLGQLRVAIAADGVKDFHSLVDYPLSLNCPAGFCDDYRPPLDIIFGQVLGLSASLKCGLMPDCPSPGNTITRVVAPIRIH